MIKKARLRRNCAPINRRSFRILFAAVLSTWPAIIWATTFATAQTVHEITIAAPNIIAVEVRDSPFQVGRIEPLSAPSREEQGAWIKVGHEWGKVIGRD